MESGFLYYFKSPQEMSTPGVNPKVVAIVAHQSGSTRRDACCHSPHACMRRMGISTGLTAIASRAGAAVCCCVAV